MQGFDLGKIRLLVSAFVSVGLLVLTIRNLEWPALVAASRTANYSFILLAAAVMIGAFGLRAWRWSYLLRPVRSLSAGTLFPVVLIGFLANYVLPARTGELVRAYVLGKREQLSKSTILGSIAVEKATDMLVLFVILFGTLEIVPLPGWISDFERGTAIVLIAIGTCHVPPRRTRTLGGERDRAGAAFCFPVVEGAPRAGDVFVRGRFERSVSWLKPRCSHPTFSGNLAYDIYHLRDHWQRHGSGSPCIRLRHHCCHHERGEPCAFHARPAGNLGVLERDCARTVRGCLQHGAAVSGSPSHGASGAAPARLLLLEPGGHAPP